MEPHQYERIYCLSEKLLLERASEQERIEFQQLYKIWQHTDEPLVNIHIFNNKKNNY